MYKKIVFLSIAIVFLVSQTSFVDQTFAQVSPEERAKLELELKQLEEESKALQIQLDGTKGERKTLEGDLKNITIKINASKNKIAQTQTTIKKIGTEIVQKENKIVTLSQKINENRDYLTGTLSDIRKLDDVRAVVALSSEGTFSEIFKDFGDYKSLQNSLADNLDGLKTNKKFIEVEKEVLLDKKDETEALKKEQEQAKKEEEKRSSEKKELINLTKQQEKDYETVLAQKAKKATEIKNKLFSFAGGQTAAIPFATALQHAELAQAQTGVPAAFVLAILTQESALGANVGRCYLTDSSTGSGINIKTNAVMKNTMKPTRDVQPFMDITTSLGMDWQKTPISCPIAGVAGWGGAMGPAQFIPSTWKTVAGRVAAIAGSSNPWAAKDSIVASATYLSDLSASSSYLSQIKAACRYYGTGGSNCSYGRQVMARVAKIQADIDYLKEYGTTRN